jgi:DNA-binding CsgD family transcriptional regulator
MWTDPANSAWGERPTTIVASGEPAPRGLVPRLGEETARISGLIGRAALDSVTSALAAVGLAALVVGRGGRVLAANGEARRLFDRELHVCNGYLRVRAKVLARALEPLLAPSSPETAAAKKMVIRREDGGPLVVTLLPAPMASHDAGIDARVILAFAPIEPRRVPDVGLLVETFGLTPAEARIAARVAVGAAPKQVAEDLAISYQNVRTTLKRVFAKTQTRRQSELTALLTRL